MLVAADFTSAATEVTSMIALAVAGGMAIFGGLKGVQVGLRLFGKLINGRA